MVLLIGVSEFPEDKQITPIPNVLANIQLLKSSLINDSLVGIPEKNIITSINESKGQIERRLRNIAEMTTDKKFTLLVYYTGHGILSSLDFNLYLTTHLASTNDLEIEGIHIDTFKNYIRRSRAGRKIVILDCCHSGAIIGGMGNVKSKIQADINSFTGTYVMTSAAENAFSLFPPGKPEKPTFFTGKLIEILNDGLETESEFCSLRDIYDKIEYDFRNEGLPLPQQSNFNRADQILFCRNNKNTDQSTPELNPIYPVEVISEAAFISQTAELNAKRLKIAGVLLMMAAAIALMAKTLASLF
jgi:hypothetical protein